MHFVIYQFVLIVTASEVQSKDASNEGTGVRFFRFLSTILDTISNSNDESFDAADATVAMVSKNKIGSCLSTDAQKARIDKQNMDKAKESTHINPESLRQENNSGMDHRDCNFLLRGAREPNHAHDVMDCQEEDKNRSATLKRKTLDSDRSAKRIRNLVSEGVRTAGAAGQNNHDIASVSNTGNDQGDVRDASKYLVATYPNSSTKQSYSGDKTAVITLDESQTLKHATKSNSSNSENTSENSNFLHLVFLIDDVGNKQNVNSVTDKLLGAKDLLYLEFRYRAKSKSVTHLNDVSANMNADSFATYKANVIMLLSRIKMRPNLTNHKQLKEIFIVFNMQLCQNLEQIKITRLYNVLARIEGLANVSPTFCKVLSAFVKDEKVKIESSSIKRTSCDLIVQMIAKQLILLESGINPISCSISKCVELQKLIYDTFAVYLENGVPENFHQTILDNILFVKTDSHETIFNEYMKIILVFMPELLVYLEFRKDWQANNIGFSGLAAEIICFKLVLLCYVEFSIASDEKSIIKLNNAVEMLRKVIQHFVILNFTNGFDASSKSDIKWIHLYEYAMIMRYSSPNIDTEDEKIANALFILSFTSDHRYFNSSKVVLDKPIDYLVLKNQVEYTILNNLDHSLSLQMLIEYYNFIGLKKSRRLMIFPWINSTLLFLVKNGEVHVELCLGESAFVILYDELMYGL